MIGETEWPTDDLRQVIAKNSALIGIERRWLVATGKSYNGEKREASDRDVSPRMNPALPVYVLPLWAKTREEWRALPIHYV